MTAVTPSDAMTTDLLVIGGGVMGLWAAWTAARAGIDTLLLDATGPGEGKASLTPVGALAPFTNAPKEAALADFQAEALMSLPATVAALEAATGCEVGYRVGGRAVPLPDAPARARAERVIAEGAARFPKAPDGGPAVWRLSDGAELAVVAPAFRAAGAMMEGVTAQLDSGAYLAALRAGVAKDARLREGWAVKRLSPAPGGGWIAEGPAGAVSAERVILAAGWGAAGLSLPLGVGTLRPVRGQAAWLRLPPGVLDEDMPVIHAQKVYVAHHGGGRVGIGATTEHGETADGTDARLDNLVARAIEIVPALAEATVERRWSAVRPRPPQHHPQIGAVPEAAAGAPGLWLAAGTYKIGVGLAHHAATGLVAAMTEQGAPAQALPEAFRPTVVASSGDRQDGAHGAPGAAHR